MPSILQALWTSATHLFNMPLFQFGENAFSLGSIIKFVLALLLIVYLIQGFRRLLANRLLTRLKLDTHNREAIATLISYSLGTLSLIVILQTVGFNLASLAVLAGGLGVGIGLGLQNLTVNFVSGINLLLARKVRVGDYVELESVAGYIQEISLQATVMRTRDGGNVVVPNHQLADSRIVNWSYDNYTARLHVPVGVAYGSDLVITTEVLLECAYAHPQVLADPAPRVIFLAFGSSSLDLELLVWVNQIDQATDIKSDLYFALEEGLRQHDIVIPFPQLDLWVRQTNPKLPDGTQPELATSAWSNSPTRSLKSLLQQVDYFKHLTDGQLRQVIESGYRQRLTTGETLFQENDPGNAFYIVLAGSVEVVSETLNKTLSILPAGKFFGELSLMLGVPRSATVRALEPTHLFAINQHGFKRLLTNHPKIYDTIVTELETHQEELAERQKQLRQLGLIDSIEDDKNLMVWVQNRLQRLFKL
ncbi:cyclic nucleotide-binding domain-containing protein [Pantanalinema rosaneae CENA516]|uniref:cyclic nucleotide-binding domain-containing protein n=1 Tax=Pantanalinema rosaneae TaxID=1620701 RepID=UPI003D6E572E